MSVKLRLEVLERYETSLKLIRKAFEIDMGYSHRYPVVSSNLDSDVICKTLALISMDRRQIAAAIAFKNSKEEAFETYKKEMKDLEPKRKPSVYFT